MGELKVTFNHRVFTAVCLVSSILSLSLGGCTQSDNVTPAAQVVPAAGAGDVHIVYQRSGGLSELEDVLRIYTSGDCELYRKNGVKYTCRIFTLKLCKLDQAFEQVGFLTMPAEYPGNSHADAIKYVIDYSVNGNEHRVTAWSNSAPDPLVPLIRELDECILLVSTACVRSQP